MSPRRDGRPRAFTSRLMLWQDGRVPNRPAREGPTAWQRGPPRMTARTQPRSRPFATAAVLTAGIAMSLMPDGPARAQIADDVARGFVARHEAQVRPLEIAAQRAWWDANVTGKDSDFAAKEEAQNRL